MCGAIVTGLQGIPIRRCECSDWHNAQTIASGCADPSYTNNDLCANPLCQIDDIPFAVTANVFMPFVRTECELGDNRFILI